MSSGKQVTTRTSAGPDSRRHMASHGHREFTHLPLINMKVVLITYFLNISHCLIQGFFSHGLSLGDLRDYKVASVQTVAWCRQATAPPDNAAGHYLVTISKHSRRCTTRLASARIKHRPAVWVTLKYSGHNHYMSICLRSSKSYF